MWKRGVTRRFMHTLLIQILEGSRIQPNSLLHTDVMKQYRKASKSPLSTGVINWKWDSQGSILGSVSDLCIITQAIFFCALWFTCFKTEIILLCSLTLFCVRGWQQTYYAGMDKSTNLPICHYFWGSIKRDLGRQISLGRDLSLNGIWLLYEYLKDESLPVAWRTECSHLGSNSSDAGHCQIRSAVEADSPAIFWKEA